MKEKVFTLISLREMQVKAQVNSTENLLKWLNFFLEELTLSSTDKDT